MEVVPSLYNLLLRMKQEGYNVSGLPANAQELAKMIQAQGAVFNSYAEGAFDEFMKNGNPELNMQKSLLPTESFPETIWSLRTDVWA